MTAVACERQAAEGLLHLSFQAPWLRPTLSSDHFPHQFIACGFQTTLLHQVRYMNPMQVLVGPAIGGSCLPKLALDPPKMVLQ